MAKYNTASEEQSKNINTFKSNCLALDSLIGKGLLSIAKDFKTVAEALEYFSNIFITLTWRRLGKFMKIPGLR